MNILRIIPVVFRHGTSNRATDRMQLRRQAGFNQTMVPLAHTSTRFDRCVAHHFWIDRPSMFFADSAKCVGRVADIRGRNADGKKRSAVETARKRRRNLREQGFAISVPEHTRNRVQYHVGNALAQCHQQFPLVSSALQKRLLRFAQGTAMTCLVTEPCCIVIFRLSRLQDTLAFGGCGLPDCVSIAVRSRQQLISTPLEVLRRAIKFMQLCKFRRTQHVLIDTDTAVRHS
ncbi:hypothetical protein WS95_04160 [Burkholderia sp. MSMB1826]|nr:hypothetical protein WS95_04160 [Burkholderia sp. MSMB1826]